MSVKIRFSRVGRPHTPFYRLVAIDQRAARDARPIEILGAFDPNARAKPKALDLNRLRYWISVGAKPSSTVLTTLKKAGIWNQVKPGSQSDGFSPQGSPSDGSLSDGSSSQGSQPDGSPPPGLPPAA